jgi:CRP-like cAMP-binding protein
MKVGFIMEVFLRDRNSDDMSLDRNGMAEQRGQGEIIYTPEQPANAAFHLSEGYVRLVNREQGIIRIIGPGEFFGDRSIFHSKNIYTEALTNIKYIRIDEPSFSQLMYSNARLAMDIVTSISRHYIYLNEKRSLLLLAKEFLIHMRRGHSVTPLFMNWKKKKERSICWN